MTTIISSGGRVCRCTDLIAATRSSHRSSVYAHITTEISCAMCVKYLSSHRSFVRQTLVPEPSDGYVVLRTTSATLLMRASRPVWSMAGERAARVLGYTRRSPCKAIVQGQEIVGAVIPGRQCHTGWY